MVRGSHRLEQEVGPSSLYDLAAAGFPAGGFAGSGAGRTEADGCAPLGLMPNAVKFVAKAGDCMVFDLATWHTAQPNTSNKERENLIMGYHAKGVGGRTGHMMSGEMVARLDTAGLLKEEAKRKLLDLP
eukprot:SAG31_NODE_90_length_26410_cov_175.663981_22_plen_129_part_00